MQQSQITSEQVSEVVYSAIRECATALRADFLKAVQDSYNASLEQNGDSASTSVLEQIIDNAMIASDQGLPICQDTGSVWVCLEVGEEATICGNVFSELDDAVRRAYTQGHLRMSMVKDALIDRSNTQTNAPAFTDVHFVPGKGIKLHVMLKGGGSDNASRLIMLSPSDGWDGIKREVISCVKEKAANACPPLLIGIGVGSTFDKVASLAKMALMRPIGVSAPLEKIDEMEKELLDEVNATDIGPGALGGLPTALGVHINTAPCHIAALPLAINMGCCAMRSATYVLVNENGELLKNPQSESWMSASRGDLNGK